MTIEKGLIGQEDINWGTSTFTRKSRSGQNISLSQVCASIIPVLDSAGKFTGTNIETALSECMTREENGSTVRTLTNKSGSQRVAGDVVIIDTANDASFTTTTTAGNVLAIGVVQETIANNATGKVATGGYVSLITLNAAATRGQYIKTFTVAGQGTPTSLYEKGVFAIALSASSAVIFGTNGDILTNPSVGNTTGLIPLSNGTLCTDLNADKLDSLTSADFLRSNLSVVQAYRASTQSINTSSSTTIIFNLVAFDTNSEYSNATGIFTVGTTGYYLVTASVQFAANVTGSRKLLIRTNSTDYAVARDNAPSATIPSLLQTSAFMYLSAGDVIYIQAWQDSGGALNTSFTDTNNWFNIIRIK